MKRLKIHRAARLAAVLAGVALLVPGGAAGATTSTWTGGSTSDTWSSGANWSGGVAPSGSVGVLGLPSAGSSCPSWGCSFGVDDILGLSVGTLQIDSSNDYLVVPAGAGNSIELSGGLSFSTGTTPVRNRLLTRMVVPLALTAGQTWTVRGAPGIPTQLALGAVTGERYPLTVRLTGGVTLQAAELDTGLLTLSGGGEVVIAPQPAQPADGLGTFPPPLIGSDGVLLAAGASLEFSSPDAVSGPVTVAPGSYSTLQVGRGVAPDGTATVDGDVTLRSNSTLQMWIDQAAQSAQSARRHGRAAPAVPQPSTDASQLTVFGKLNLNDANLALSQGFTDTQIDCAALSPGQVYTLVAATEVLGTFDNIGSGQVVPLGVCDPLGGGPSYAVIISYNTRAKPQTITATIVGPAQIRALVARTLTVPPAAAKLAGVLAAGGYNTTFDAPATGTLSLTWTAVSHHRAITVATGSSVAGQVGPRRLLITLTAPGLRLLHAAEHPPSRKPRKPKRTKGKKQHRPKPPPRPKPRPVTITATANFTPGAPLGGPVRISGRFTLR